MKTICFFLLAIVIAAGCTKTRVVTTRITIRDTVATIDTPVEMPFKNTIARKMLVDTAEVFTDGPWEQGNVFYSSENGMVSKLGAIFPVNGTYRVSLWDYEADTLLASANVICTDSTQLAYTAIVPVNITADKKYMLTNNTNGNPYYSYQLKSGYALDYPYSVANITILDFYYTAGTDAVIPAIAADSRLINSDIVFRVK